MQPQRSRCALHVTTRMRADLRRTDGHLQRCMLLSLVLGAGLAGCGGFDPVATYEQNTDPTKLFMALTIDHPAVNLSTAPGYNTLQLTATPRNAVGEPMTDLPEPVFHLEADADSTKVTVTSAGLLTARGATSGIGVLVIAELRAGDNVRQVDSTLVKVVTNAMPPVLASLSVQPVSSDSAIRSMSACCLGPSALTFVGLAPLDLLSPVALDAADVPIADLAIEYTSLDPTVATINRWSGQARYLSPGQARLAVRTTAYGITKADTVVYTVTLPISQEIVLQPDVPLQKQREVRLMPHGYVFWYWQNDGKPVGLEVMFEDPARADAAPAELCGLLDGFVGAGACGTGDFSIPLPPAPGQFFQTLRVRRFHVPGIYTYHTSAGDTGRIIVSAGD